MSKILIIAEKPSVAEDYAKALNQYSKKDGYYEGDRYVITWVFGHIVSRKELYEYDGDINRAAQNRAHVLETIPYFPEKHILKLSLKNTEFIKGDKVKLEAAKRNNSGITSRAKVIKSLFDRKDIALVVNGCDAGREGEAIFWQTYDFLGCKLPFKRLWLSATTTEDVIREANNLRDYSAYENLKKASYARAEMDWEHGLNLSVLYSSLYGAQLTIGRVQTPVLNMVIDRENEIKNFVSKDYYLLDATFSTDDSFKYKGRLVIDNTLGDILEDGKITDISKINNIVNFIENKQGVIKSIDKSKKKESPKLLFNLGELQKEMSRKHRMTAQEVLSVAQSLYETHKLTSYPRTNSQYLNQSMKDEIFQRLNHLPSQYDNIVNYAKNSGSFYDTVLNDKKVEDHYGLIPTINSKKYDLSKLNANEKIIYEAIVKRFISLFMPNHEYESTVITTSVGEYIFKTTGKKIISQGWKALYNVSNVEEDESDNKDESKEDTVQDLTYNFEKDMPILCVNGERKDKKTLPPKRYLDGTLVGVMEVGGPKNVDIQDEERLELLKERGLGTPATRAGIIENILGKGYVERDKKKNIVPTERGMEFMNRVSIDLLKSPEITGDWEYKLKQIEKGNLTKESLLKEARLFITECVEKVKSAYKEGDRIASGNELGFKCPLCGGAILKSPKAYYCVNTRDNCTFSIVSQLLKKKLKDSDIKDLCEKGTTKLLKGFANPKKLDANGKPIEFDAYLVLNKEEGKIQFGYGDKKVAREKKDTGFLCPKCGKPISEYDTWYSCSGYRDGCTFSIFKELYSKKISNKDMEDLLKNGSTGVFVGLFSPKNPQKKFSAKVVLKENMPTIVYLNESGEADIGQPSPYFCPSCNSSMEEYNGAFRCTKCKFGISKVIAGVTLSKEYISQICADKKMKECIDFVSNAGNNFKARLVFNTKNKKLEFQRDSVATRHICPLCKGEIGEGEKAYSCLKCNLTVWKSIGEVVLSDEIIGEIFKNKETSDYIDLISAKGNAYKAKLVVNTKDKKVDFIFPPRGSK